MAHSPSWHDRNAFTARNTEIDALFGYYEYLKGFPQDDHALFLLRRTASLVKPIMRKRGWKVGLLAEFFPPDPNLQGLNVNRTEKIFLRLRPGHRRDVFLQLEVITDTLLHELAHIVWGPHDQNFHRLWEELREEHQTLLLKGYTGEGMLSDGHLLGGRGIPMHEARHQARLRAEKRHQLNKLSKGSGSKVGGNRAGPGADIRRIIADAASRRNKKDMGCGAGNKAAESQATEQARKNGFRTKAEEDDANDLAIANAMIDLMEKDEERKLNELYAPQDDGGLSWTPEGGLQFDEPVPRSVKSAPPKPMQHPRARGDRPVSRLVADHEANRQLRPGAMAVQPPQPAVSINAVKGADIWSCAICTLVNPWNYLCCDACGVERPSRDHEPSRGTASSSQAFTSSSLSHSSLPSKPLGWNCSRCGSFMDTQWWTCSLCGIMKDVS